MEAMKLESTQQRGHWGRLVLMTVCAVAVAGALWQMGAAWPRWAAVVGLALAWPWIALRLAKRSGYSDGNDVILTFLDGIIVGAWIALASFNLLVSSLILIILAHSTYALQSARHTVLGIAGAIAGLALTGLMTSFSIQKTSILPVDIGCITALALYLAAQGLATDRLLQTLAHKEQMLSVLRRVDALTGFFGRAYWNDLAVRLFAYARQKDLPAFMLIVDIDNFRDINLRKGEAAGDEIIIAVANTLRTCVRPGDATCRFGGDAFGVMLSGVNLEVASRIADRIHQQVQNRRLRDLSDVSISVSIGIASLAKHHQSAEEWIKQTETALEQAKGAPRMSAPAPAVDLQPISAEHLAELARETESAKA